MATEALRPNQTEQDPWQGTYGGAAPSESLRAEWHGVTSRALSRMSATPDNDVVPMDPALVNQMQNLCQRLGLAVSSDPEALLEHLVAWGHKVLDHQDHLQHQLDVLKHDIMSPCRSASGSSAASRSSRASSRSSTSSARSSADGSGPKPRPARAADGVAKGGAGTSSGRSTGAASGPTSTSAFAAAAAAGGVSSSSGLAASGAPASGSMALGGSGSGGARRYASGIDAELQQWLQQLDEVWQLQGAGSVGGSRRSSASEAGGNSSNLPQGATSIPTAGVPAATAAAAGGGAGSQGGAGISEAPLRPKRKPSLEASGRSASPAQPLLLPEAAPGLKGVLPLAPGSSTNSGGATAAYAQQVTPRALSPAVFGVAASAGLRTPAAPITPGPNDATYQATRARTPGAAEEAAPPAAAAPSGSTSRASAGLSRGAAGRGEAGSANSSPVRRPELEEPAAPAAAAAASPPGFPGRALWPAAAAAAVGAPVLPLLGASSSSSALGSPGAGLRALGRHLSSPELGASMPSPGGADRQPLAGGGLPLLPRGSLAASTARSVGRPPVPPSNRDGLGLLLQPWQPPQHQVPTSGGLPQPVFVANAGAAWMPTDTAAAARTAALTAHLRRGGAASGSTGAAGEAGGEAQPSPSAAALALATQRATAASQLAKRAGIMGVSHVRLQPSPIAAALQRGNGGSSGSLASAGSRRTGGSSSRGGGPRGSAHAAAADASSSSGSEGSGSSGSGRSSNSRNSAAARARRSQAAQAAAAVLGLATVPEQVHLAERVGRSRHFFKAAGGRLLHLLQQLQQRVLHPAGLLLWLQQRAQAVAQGASADGMKGVTTWLALAGVLGCSVGGLVAAVAAARSHGDATSDGSSKQPPAKQQRRKRVLMQQLRHQPAHLLPHWEAYEEAGVPSRGRMQPLRLPRGPKGLGAALPTRSKSPEAPADGTAGAIVPLSHPLASLPGSAAAGGGAGAWAGEVAEDLKQLLQPALDRLAHSSSKGSSSSSQPADANAARSSNSNSLGVTPALQDLPGGHLRHKASSSKKDQSKPAAGGADIAGAGSSTPATPQKIYWFALPASDQVVRQGQGRKGGKAVRQQKAPVVTQVTPVVQERLQPALKRLAATRQA